MKNATKKMYIKPKSLDVVLEGEFNLLINIGSNTGNNPGGAESKFRQPSSALDELLNDNPGSSSGMSPDDFE